MLSHPARGAWIEISEIRSVQGNRQSHPARGAWIEICTAISALVLTWSHPARGAWIEIYRYEKDGKCKEVAPRKGCVD